jgi:hypothetical protein
MFRIWKVIYATGGFAPFMDAPDAAGVGDGVDPGDGGDGDTPSGDEGDAADTGDQPAQSAADADDDEVDDDPDLKDDAEWTPDRGRRVLKKLRKYERRDRKFAGERAILRTLRERGVTIDQLLVAQRQNQQFNAMLASNPRMRALLNGGETEPAEERRTPAAKEEPEEVFDESKIPFDSKDNEVNAYLVSQARDLFDTKKLLKQALSRIEQLDTRDTTRTETQVRHAWKSSIESAAAKIEKPSVRRMFMDNIAAQFNDKRVRDTYTPQQLVGYYLSQLERDGLVTKAEAAASVAAAAAKPGAKAPVATAATKARIAEANKNLPRTSAVNGTPAPANGQRSTLAGIRKRIAASVR